MIWKAGGALLLLILLFYIGTPAITSGVHNWRTDEITQYAVVETGAGITTGTVVLDRDLFQNHVSEVISMSSSITETPVPTDYTSSTNTLTIAALDDSTSRTLTIEYYAPVEDDVMDAIGPFLLILIFLFVIGMIVWGVFHKGRSG